MFSSKSVDVLLEYSSYNYVINLKEIKELSFKLLYNLYNKEIEVLREYLNSII